MKLSEAIQRAIPLSRAMSDYWEAELPKRFENYPFVQEGEDRGPMPPEQVELKKLLDSLSEEDLYRMQLLIEFGWGALRPDKLAGRLQELEEERDPKILAYQFSEHLDLWLMLEDGLERMRKYGIDVDAMLPVAKSA